MLEKEEKHDSIDDTVLKKTLINKVLNVCSAVRFSLLEPAHLDGPNMSQNAKKKETKYPIRATGSRESQVSEPASKVKGQLF